MCHVAPRAGRWLAVATNQARQAQTEELVRLLRLAWMSRSRQGSVSTVLPPGRKHFPGRHLRQAPPRPHPPRVSRKESFSALPLLGVLWLSLAPVNLPACLHPHRHGHHVPQAVCAGFSPKTGMVRCNRLIVSEGEPVTRQGRTTQQAVSTVTLFQCCHSHALASFRLSSAT
ncbi:hypothetical protein E2C01_097349 [Portunus trituberculatus]|uniref:Uncharacterized protein n=1 Tax=Portunus trituberculatus TaxID=210409 RepID=A0A5B7K5G9_PORTR|nr:hypothetical protein [Portunus trituberculatus]